ncbi:E3 ubiquitin-protein ligase, putative (DUF177) isoform X2 [Wolffia australiana]
MAAARSYGQQPISHVLQPIRRRWVTIGHRISVPPPGSCGGARAAAADFAAEEKRAAAAAARRGPKAPRRLITISTADGRWQGEWNCDYVFTLRELGLGDVADLGQADAAVLIRLLVQKHAGFGFSVEGKIATCFPRKCSGCLSTFDKEIDASFDVWVLPSSRSDPAELPEIGSGDPSVYDFGKIGDLREAGNGSGSRFSDPGHDSSGSDGKCWCLLVGLREVFPEMELY